MATLEKSGLILYVLEMANLREQCAWPHFDFPEEATRKVKDLINAVEAKARLDESLKKKSMSIGKRVLVIGAVISGIQTSLDLGDAGFEVYLVEKSSPYTHSVSTIKSNISRVRKILNQYQIEDERQRFVILTYEHMYIIIIMNIGSLL